jgi:hypothetical protein
LFPQSILRILDIIIRKITNLARVNPFIFFIFRHSQVEAAQVHEKQNYGGNDERVDDADDAVAKLFKDLDIVAIQPTAIDFSDAVKCSNVLSRKDPPTISSK